MKKIKIVLVMSLLLVISSWIKPERSKNSFVFVNDFYSKSAASIKKEAISSEDTLLKNIDSLGCKIDKLSASDRTYLRMLKRDVSGLKIKK